MQLRPLASAAEAASLSTEKLRERFLVEALFHPGEIRLTYWEADRTVIGAAVPTDRALALGADPLLRAGSFLERRELGVLNLGGPGKVGAAGASHALNRDDGLYLGRGVEGVEFRSDDAARPARFYLVSYPAHTAHPTRVIRAAEAATLQLGQPAEANHRTIHKYIHSGGVTSCQLTMGITRLQPGSVWNTMPPHTHSRRTEVYLYFDLPPENMVIHLMGEPQATRHLLVRNEEVILSPAWSIHCGAGTRAYQFAWAMGGENQDFADMDRIPVSALR